ncbi:hypothetical protein H4R18_005407 [Coemansia javaensis]|uniref:Uncharacterized protein n=1 Tax=Coemansia javaensis TaxID=2761396 RepID=A0A9W8H627_9FUNG|nr:hypothetical protein H4R18_005407 [Coemansia javaensis]
MYGAAASKESFAASDKESFAARAVHSAVGPQNNTTKPPAKLVQYRREKSSAATQSTSASAAAAASGLAQVPYATADHAPDLEPLAGPHQGAWAARRPPGAPQDADADEGAVQCAPGEHPLCFAWSFWFMHRAPGHKISDYEAAMTKIATFASAESFWAVYSHLKRADQVPTITDYHMFRAGVRPVWEDPENINGGKWMLRLKKGLSPRLWERLAIAVVGNAFGAGDEICGIVLSIRNSEDIISLWNKTAVDTKATLHIRDALKRIMCLPADCTLEYKAHNDSLRDNSSFRNTGAYAGVPR